VFDSVEPDSELDTDFDGTAHSETGTVKFIAKLG